MSERVVFPTDWDDQGTRKSSFGLLFVNIAEHFGYTKLGSLKVPGSYCYEFEKDGKVHRIGLKTAYDRFLNTAFVMGEKVDEVWVIAFKWNDDEADDVDWRPTGVQVYRISAEKLGGLFDKVHEARAKSTTSKRAPYAFIPIDRDNLGDPKLSDFDRVVGPMEDHMELFYEAPLSFSDVGNPRIKTDEPVVTPAPIQAASDPSQGLQEQLLAHKQALAKLLGTSVDKLRIHVEL